MSSLGSSSSSSGNNNGGNRDATRTRRSRASSVQQHHLSVPPPSLVDILNYSQQLPFIVSISQLIGGTTLYEYKFHVETKESKEDKVETKHQFESVVEIRKIDSNTNKRSKPVKNNFTLIKMAEDAYIFWCKRINGGTKVVTPAITFSIEYNKRSRSWIALEDFSNVRAALTMNTFEDGFGLLATLAAGKVQICWSCRDGAIEHTSMSMECRSMGNLFVLNRAKAEDSHLEEDEDEQYRDEQDGGEPNIEKNEEDKEINTTLFTNSKS